jgi:hypothetical protein
VLRTWLGGYSVVESGYLHKLFVQCVFFGAFPVIICFVFVVV